MTLNTGIISADYKNVTKALICYHDNCIDGFTSAWVTNKYLVEKHPDAEIELMAMNYGPNDCVMLLRRLDELEHLFSHVFIVDFSVPIPILQCMAVEYPDMVTVVLDHHKTALEMYASTSLVASSIVAGATVHIDMKECGASLCWKHFFPRLEVPTLIEYVKDYDLWTYHRGVATKHFNKFLKTREKSFRIWEGIHQCSVRNYDEVLEDLLDIGEGIQIYHDNLIQEIVANARPVILGGRIGLGVAAPASLASDIGNVLAQESGSFGVSWRPGEQASKELCYSIRSIKATGFEVEPIARLYHGGGHACAAGFTTRNKSEDWCFLEAEADTSVQDKPEEDLCRISK